VSGLAERRLYCCTPNRADLASFVGKIIDGGVDLIQLRAKDLEARALLEAAARCQAVCADRGVPFIMNDRPDLALELGADGVHVGQDDAPVALCRRILGPDAIVGLSTHASGELAEALAEDVTYLSAGPVEATPTKPGRAGTGLGYVGEAVAAASVPVFVTGGVTTSSIAELAGVGVTHFVVVRALTEADDPFQAARALRKSIDGALGL
jgi:thiamine-phosphate pyrophosphorylase